MANALKGVAQRGALAFFGLAEICVGAGLLTAAGYRELALAYDPLIAGVVFGLGVCVLGAFLLLIAKPHHPPHPTPTSQPEALIGACLEGIRQGQEARAGQGR